MNFFISEKMNYILRYFIAFMTLLILGTIIFIFFYSYEKDKSLPETANIVSLESKESADITKEPVEENKNFYIDIKGAVKSPGVYLVNSDNIINDVINLAGGLNKNASTKYLNLSMHVSKEMVIYIYTTNEEKNQKTENKTSEPCVCPTEKIDSCIDSGSNIIINKSENNNSSSANSNSNKVDSSSNKEEIKTDDKSQSEKPINSKININTSTKEELTSLSGIGDSKAEAIIKYRNENGQFKKIEDIVNVSGISNNIFEKIKDNITV